MSAPTPFTIVNIHPADELAALREEIAQLEKRANYLRDKLLSGEPGQSTRGEQYEALIIPGKRETLDRAALVETYGEAAIQPFLKVTNFKTVKLREIEKNS